MKTLATIIINEGDINRLIELHEYEKHDGGCYYALCDFTGDYSVSFDTYDEVIEELTDTLKSQYTIQH